jgi:hypothetical protein
MSRTGNGREEGRSKERIDFVNLADHLGPALGGKAREVLLGHPEYQGIEARLLKQPIRTSTVNKR